ncbi:MAG: hypothetical protein LBL31_03025 [Spirochaetaceae bacterium]|nr:hypothetical protein [Spirochaetaceae bacterium]
MAAQITLGMTSVMRVNQCNPWMFENGGFAAKSNKSRKEKKKESVLPAPFVASLKSRVRIKW